VLSFLLSSPKEDTVDVTSLAASSGSSKKKSSKKKKEMLKAFLESLNDSSDEDEEDNFEASSEPISIQKENDLGIPVTALKIIILNLKIYDYCS
jgi:hypothetical protein